MKPIGPAEDGSFLARERLGPDQEPRISVPMPVYNTGRYLDQAVRSVLSQTYRDFEFIVVDDGSTDDSARTLNYYASHDGRMRWQRIDHAGNIAARNACLSLASGPLIAWLDSDDVAHPDWLMQQLAHMEANPDCVAVGCQAMLIEEGGGPLGVFSRPLDHDRIDRINLDGLGGGVLHSAVLMRRWAVDAAGGYDKNMKTVEDTDLLLRMAERGRLANLPDVLLWRRLHPGSVSHAEHAIQSQMKVQAANAARQRRGLPRTVAPERERPVAPGGLWKDCMWRAYKNDYQVTALRLAVRLLLSQPLSWPAVLVLVRALLRIVRGKLRIRGGPPRLAIPVVPKKIEPPGRAETWHVEPRTTTDFSLKSILLYNPSNRGFESEFWPKLRKSLRAKGFELFSIGCEEGRNDLPHIYLPYGLDAVRSEATLAFKWARRWALKEQEILDREALFTGKPGDSKARTHASHQIATLQAATLAHLKPRLVVLWNGEQTQQLILRQLLEGTGCPFTRIERSPFPGVLYEDPRGPMADASFARAPIRWPDSVTDKEWMAKQERYTDRVVTRGTTWWGEERRSRRSLPKFLGIPKNATVVFFAAQVDCDTQNFFFSPYFDRNVAAFEAFCRLAKKAGNVYVIGKHHPKSETPPKAYTDVLRGGGAWLTDATIEDCFDAADAVAAVNSSVLFEAALRGKRCLALGRTMLQNRNVFYEMRNAEDEETFGAWLSGDDAVGRQRRWRRVVSWLLANHLYSMTDDDDVGLNNHEHLAERLVALAAPSAPDYSAMQRASWSVLNLFHALNQVS